MVSTALEKIAAIQEDAKQKIEALRSEAVSDIAKRLSVAKDLVRELQGQYESITGKTTRGERVSGTRKRLSLEQKRSLSEACAEFIKSKPNGVSMGDIVRQTGESPSAVRDAVKQVQGLRVTGNKASTLYHAS